MEDGKPKQKKNQFWYQLQKDVKIQHKDTGIFFRVVNYSTYDVTSNLFQTSYSQTLQERKSLWWQTDAPLCTSGFMATSKYCACGLQYSFMSYSDIQTVEMTKDLRCLHDATKQYILR
jgi:hypothetical protein